MLLHKGLGEAIDALAERRERNGHGKEKRSHRGQRRLGVRTGVVRRVNRRVGEKRGDRHE